MHLTILYRGSLVSCNYGCEYCPFAKRQQSAAELTVDRQSLEKFANWIADHPQHEFSILFTPWGEALIYSWYQQTLVHLSHLSNVRKVAIQTNLSCSLEWIEQANRDRLALWATFHPEWSTLDRFLEKCDYLQHYGIRFSVGVVGFPRFKAAIATLRQQLPKSVYLWINAVKAELPHLPPDDHAFFQSIDPLYHLNTHHYPSLGKSCRAGESVISVDGEGTIRRCHFIKPAIGNIYDSAFEMALFERLCTNETCHCHIGYVHLNYLELDKIFGSGILERVPIAYQ
ncbi:radical SAM protein [Trichocoleus sp. FACHB-591]|uniref:STM4011 family radical SAM protein n=1 Tax=Trichocoleus sp. FACHB-591 TaxID=2692872 RepID=UPI001689847F|nr:STM4011 family radical SAM protein [Trichocoleus sp. FACHB-591]MBD2096398.1 radical SAM protein [Trichocoleus sp. FACHB-591]